MLDEALKGSNFFGRLSSGGHVIVICPPDRLGICLDPIAWDFIDLGQTDARVLILHGPAWLSVVKGLFSSCFSGV